MNTITIEKSPHLAEVTLAYRCSKLAGSLPTITCPQDAEIVLRAIWDRGTIQLKEEFVVLLLNSAKKCIGWNKVSSGGATSTIVDPSTIFQLALLGNASSIIIAHNHPSGNTAPSAADKNITRRIIDSGKMLGIDVDDHFILTAHDCISFRTEGIVWE